MRRKAIDVPAHAHFLTWSIHRRERLFLMGNMARLFLQKLDQARSRMGFEVWAYVVMPDHIHLLLWSDDESFRISKATCQIKQPFAKSALGLLRDSNDPMVPRLSHVDKGRRMGRVWQAGGGYDRNLYTDKNLRAAVDYIHSNPIRAGLVERAEDYLWTSAAFYLDLPHEFSVDRARYWGITP